MRKILAPLVAIAFGLGSLNAFAADDMSKDNKPVKKAKKGSAKKTSKSTQMKKNQAAK
jgi:hypothetical protein